MFMDKDRERKALLSKLARCRELAGEFLDGPTAEMIRDLEVEIQQELIQLDEKS